jgi:hypothetical protein
MSIGRISHEVKTSVAGLRRRGWAKKSIAEASNTFARVGSQSYGFIPIFSLIAPSSASSQMPISTPFFTWSC